MHTCSDEEFFDLRAAVWGEEVVLTPPYRDASQEEEAESREGRSFFFLAATLSTRVFGKTC